MHKILFLTLVMILFVESLSFASQPITTGSLLREMVDLDRLTYVDTRSYRAVQFSSYDRRSVAPDKPNWFGNADGFGWEPIPGFEKVIREPDSTGIGEYLICDVPGAGAIVRLWTANISGRIKMFLDGKIIYDGEAEKFFWDFPNNFYKEKIDLSNTLRQFDALYFPIAFAKRCRIEWQGRLADIHFYHIGMKLYGDGVGVRTFQASDLNTYKADIDKTIAVMCEPDVLLCGSKDRVVSGVTVPVSVKQNIVQLSGQKAISELSFKLHGENLDEALRKTIIRIFFDNSSIPQVESPLGDLFGAAPGVNPYVSLPLTVGCDSVMTSRFVMPFKERATIQVENQSEHPIRIDAMVRTKAYEWDSYRSMYFRARWRVNHDLNSADVKDIPYLVAIGNGRVVGAACYLMNPSNVPSASGNWWGEGDEKIFIDNGSQLAFFGTGSEDYFNYSWSSDEIFSYPYCGQPRDDGPSTRGFVSNFRWHINDDIPFEKSIAFYMELRSHGVVDNLTYARMVYLYARPGMIDDHAGVSKNDTRKMEMPIWNPISFRGSMGYGFVESELALVDWQRVVYDYNVLWSGGKMTLWSPTGVGDKMDFAINTSAKKACLQLSVCRMPLGGKFALYVNGKPIKLRPDKYAVSDFAEQTDLSEPGRILNRTYISETIDFKDGDNLVTIESRGENGSKIGLDFFWVKN